MYTNVTPVKAIALSHCVAASSMFPHSSMTVPTDISAAGGLQFGR